MDHLAIPSECRQQAAHCRNRAETVIDERVRAVLVSVVQMWTMLAEEAERLLPSKPKGELTWYRYEQSKSRLAAHAPQCVRCRKPMNVRILFPGRKVDDVAYRCEDCGEEVMCSVPPAR